MPVQVEIIGVGAYVPTAGSDQPRPYFRGATATLDEDVAKALVENGTAKYLEAGDEPATSEVLSLDDMDVRALREFATKEDISLHGATKKAEIRKAIDDALAAPSTDETPDLTTLDDEALLALVEERQLDVPADADRDALIALLSEGDE